MSVKVISRRVTPPDNCIRRLRQRRLQAEGRRWTRARVATRIGVSDDTLKAWEEGRCPRADHAIRLARDLGVRVEQLFYMQEVA